MLKFLFIISVIIFVVGIGLFFWELMNSNNSNKKVKDTKLLLYSKIMFLGIVLSAACGLFLVISKA